MKYTFPERLSSPRHSLIREVAKKGSEVPGFISLALGNPAPEGIPAELIRIYARQVFEEDSMSVLQYGPSAGDENLKAWIRDRMVSHLHAPADGNDVTMFTGSGKALAMLPRILCSPGDEVFCDPFTYPNAFNSILNNGALPVPVLSDADGILPDALEKAAKKGKGKALYLIPNFHNPLGTVIPEKRRRELYEVAARYGLIIYEDDPYGDIRFAGSPVPSFKSMDREGIVIYAGSFSKTLSAGLRVGYTYAPSEISAKMMQVKDADGQDPLYNQRLVAKLLQRLDFDKHCEEISAIYGRKCRTMERAIRRYVSPACTFCAPEGGMFLWLEIPDSVDIDAMSDACIRAGVGAVKSAAFMADPAFFAEHPQFHRNAFRLNFSALPEEKIEEAVKRFGEVSLRYCS